MRIANLSGRLVLIREDRAIDVADASAGRFSADPQAAYATLARASRLGGHHGTTRAGRAGIRSTPANWARPLPRRAKFLAIGLNYREHAAESGFAVPDTLPPVFTKFASAITGPGVHVAMPPARPHGLGGRARRRDRRPRLPGSRDAWNTSRASPSARTCPNGSPR